MDHLNTYLQHKMSDLPYIETNPLFCIKNPSFFMLKS